MSKLYDKWKKEQEENNSILNQWKADRSNNQDIVNNSLLFNSAERKKIAQNKKSTQSSKKRSSGGGQLGGRSLISSSIQMPQISTSQNMPTILPTKTDIINNQSSVKNNIPIKLATTDEVKNAEEMTTLGIQARQEAIDTNKEIAKGGINKLNAYMRNTLNAIPGGVTSVTSGLGNVATTAGGLVTKGASKAAELLGNEEAAEKLNDAYNNIIEKGRYINEKGNYSSNVNSQIEDTFTRDSHNVVNTISQMLTTFGLGEITGIAGAGTTMQGLFVGGNSAQEVLNKNRNNIGKATVTGVLKGTVSYLTEKMFESNIFRFSKKMPRSSIQNKINEMISNRIQSEFGKEAMYRTIGVIGENAEELAEDFADTIIDMSINNTGSLGEYFRSIPETLKLTSVSTVIMSLLGIGGPGFSEVEKDMNAQRWVNEAQRIIEQENLGIKYSDKANNVKIPTNKQPQTTKTNQILPIDEVIRQNDTTESNKNIAQDNTNYKIELLEEINNSKMSDEEKMQMLQVVESTNLNEETYNDIKETINQTNSLIEQQTIAQENKMAQNQNKKATNSRQTYMKYKNDTNTYDATEVNEVLDTTPTNRNGKRTVKQWLQVANEIGTRLADKSDAEIERIAYKSWFDTQPTKSITRYDNQAKTNLPFQKLTADEWVDTISKAANEARSKTQNTNINQTKATLPMRPLTYEESAKKYNIDTNNETVKSINRVANQRGIQARYDADLFDNNNANALWRTTRDQNGNIQREVVLNPNANTNKTLQNIIVHELTHDFEGTNEYNQLKSLVLNYDKGNIGYREARTSLEELYSKVYDRNSSEFQTLVDNEAVADILGNKLGDQDFINNLSMKEPSLARKIYNWIVDKLNKLTGHSNEKLFWEDVRNKFENAYRQEYQATDTTKYHISKNLSNDIDNILSNINERNPVRLRDYTPAELVKFGIKDLPIYENPSHIRKNILTTAEAINLGLTVNAKDHYHGLGKETYMKAIDSLDDPRVIFKNKNNAKEYLILTVVKDNNNNNIIVPIEVETDTYVNNIKIDINRAKTVFGYDRTNPNLDEYIKYNIKNNNLEKIYEKKKPSTNITSQLASINNSIPSSNENVNTTKYSIQESENNSDSLNLPKVKEGYTRLYRGLESEYNPQYDKSKLDNVNGYESWTDNYDLAKAYGDNVYYIDILTSEIKNSIIDEDSTSETYGDRHLIYKNDKPVGINGKSGNEYMIYTDHDNYKNIKYNKIENVAQDNQGRKLSKKQQEYFKDSKVRNDKGELETVYHTTTDKVAQFNEFNPVGTPYYRFGDQIVNYYTDSKDMSGSYADNQYKLADTRRINNMQELNTQLNEINEDIKDFYNIELTQEEDGSYTVTINYNFSEDKSFGVIDKEIKELKESDANLYNALLKRAKENENPYNMFSGLRNDIVDEFLYKLTSKDPKAYTAGETARLVKQYLTSSNLGEINFTNQENLFRNFKVKLQKEFPRVARISNIQYEGYVNITNPYIVDAEERNWNRVVEKSNDFIDELDNRIPQDVKNKLVWLYVKSQNLSSDLREQYGKYQKIIENISNDSSLSEDTKHMSHLIRRLGLEDINNLYDGKYNELGVSAWNVVADVLEADGVIGKATAKFINDEWRLPENIKRWIDNEYTKRIAIKIDKGAEYFTSLKELFEDNSNAYEKFNKYRYPQDYFIEKISGDSNAEDFVDIGEELNDIFEMRAEIVGAEQVAQELAQAASVNFSKPEMIRLWGTSKTTNDVVKEIIASNKDGKTNYDGVIIKNVYDYGGRSNSKEPGNIYVTFNSNQFKSIDNINPTSDADIRYSQNNNKWQKYLDENYKNTGRGQTVQEVKLPIKSNQNNKIPNTKLSVSENTTTNTQTEITPPIDNNLTENEKIAEILNTPVQQQKPQQRVAAILKANLIDKGAVFEDISKKINNRELEAKWDSTLSSGAKGQYAIGNDRYEFNNGEKTRVSKSLESIIEEVGDKESEFQNYMYHQLNVDRMTLDKRFGIDNKPVFGKNVGAEYSRQMIQEYEKNNPEFKRYAQDVYDYLNANKQELVNSGVISEELSEHLAERYPHYVPIKRVGVNGNAIAVPLDTRRTGINAPLKKAKGGSQDIQPLFSTIADRTLQTYRASARNSFGVELKNSLDELNMLNNTSENVDIDDIIDTMADEEKNSELLKKGEKGQNPTFTVFENGNKITYDISEDMYDALKPKNELFTKFDNSKLGKAIQKVSSFRRALITEYNPLFALTNSMKDIQDALPNSQHATETYAKFPEAYAQILWNGYYYQEYMQNGGEQNSYFKDGDFEIKKKNTVPNKIMGTVTIPLKAISKVNNVIEMAPRLAEYIASRESGRSVETSMLDAARVTTNFKAGGELTKFLNRNGFTFLNAGVQGLEQNIRNIRETHQKGLKGYAVLATKMAIAGLPALLLNGLIWKDDDDYEDLQDYVKDNYYIIGKYGKGQFIRIPKGRVVSVIQKVLRNADEFINNKNEIDADEYASQFWKDLKEDVIFGIDNIAPNNPIENNILSPLFQAITNKTWYGGDLVPTRLQDKPAGEQYDETTDKFSKWLGGKIGVSPIKINYLLDQYTGGIGDVLLPMGTPQAENNAIEDKFTTNSVMKSRYPGEFFEKFDELNIQNNSEKATDEDEIKYKYFSTLRSDLSDLYKQKRDIQNSSISDKEKKEQLLEVQKQINDIAKEGLNEVKNIKISGNTATAGEEQYYRATNTKDGTTEWKKLTDEEVKKNKDISLKTYADYKEKVANETIKQRKSGSIKEDGNIKDKDQIQIIVNSSYSNKEKEAIYEKYINSKDSTYDIMKNTGIDINEYLKYKMQEFESDKQDDGTTTGKSVSGSKKAKVYDYVNKMNITYNQRLMLLGTQYKLSDTERSKVAQYVNSLKISKANKLSIYEKLKGFTVYKDGRVTW